MSGKCMVRDDGAFSVGQLGTGTVRFEISKGREVLATRSLSLFADSSVDIPLASLRSLEGRVVTDEGEPAGPCIVSAESAGSGLTAESEADEAGRFRFSGLPEGRYELRVRPFAGSSPSLGYASSACSADVTAEATGVVISVPRLGSGISGSIAGYSQGFSPRGTVRVVAEDATGRRYAGIVEGTGRFVIRVPDHEVFCLSITSQDPRVMIGLARRIGRIDGVRSGQEITLPADPGRK